MRTGLLNVEVPCAPHNTIRWSVWTRKSHLTGTLYTLAEAIHFFAAGGRFFWRPAPFF